MKKQTRTGSALLFVLFFLTGITLFFARLITSTAYTTSMAAMRLRHHQNEALAQGAHRYSKAYAKIYFSRIQADGNVSFTQTWGLKTCVYTSVATITAQSEQIVLVQTKLYKGKEYCGGFSSCLEKQPDGFKQQSLQRL